MNVSVEQHEFQAEVKQLLDLMVHSLYSNKDIFLRELISNASDALDRLRFERLTNKALGAGKDPEIRLSVDEDRRALTISDNGVGMSREEVIRNLGTIAQSGTKEFLSAVKQSKEASAPELIGQFGVGFYSSFMVANKVTVLTRRAGEEKGTLWISEGDGRYSISEADRDEHGTTITLELKDEDEENSVNDYTDEGVLRHIVKRYSDFVAYPIKMQVWRDKDEEEGDAGGKVLEELTLNSQKAIWARDKNEVGDEELREFYRHISHDWSEPLENIWIRIEGTFEAQGLLFLPSRAPFDLYHPEMKRGVQLYVKRVFIMDECKELLPIYLRFIKGVVDAQDLSLNVSREILQKDRQIRLIRKQLVKKIFDTLDGLREKEREKYTGFWHQFGPALKEGLVAGEAKEQDRILENMLFSSTHSETELSTLDDYIARMKEDQKSIYYLTGPSLAAVKSSPHLEAFKAKGYEVIYFTDQIDEIWLERGRDFKEKALQSVGKGEVELDSKEEQEAKKKDKEAKEKAYKDLMTCLRAHLQDEVKEVRLSSRLTSSAACLVSEEGDITPQMERLMKQLNQEVPKVKRVLELNPSHEIMAKLQKMFEANSKDPLLKDHAELLYGQALLAEGSQLPDPARFSKLVADLMVRAA